MQSRRQISVMTLVAMAALGVPRGVLAHGATAGSQPLVAGHVSVRYLKPVEIVALFAREGYAGPAEAGQPRAARAGNPETLLPGGVDALLRAEMGEVILVGSGDELRAVAACIGIVDVPREEAGTGRQKVVLTPRQSDLRRLRTSLLRLTPAGVVKSAGRELTLEGAPEWLHRALREVIRQELHLPLRAPDSRAP